MESCPDKLNRERGEVLALSKSIEAPAQASVCPRQSLPKKPTAESYIYPPSNLMGKESLSQGNYFAPKGLIKYKTEFPQDFSPGGHMQSCFFSMVSPSCILCLEISVFLRKKCYCGSSRTGGLRTLCPQEALLKARSWHHAGSGPCPSPALGVPPALPEGQSLLQTQSHGCCRETLVAKLTKLSSLGKHFCFRE